MQAIEQAPANRCANFGIRCFLGPTIEASLGAALGMQTAVAFGLAGAIAASASHGVEFAGPSRETTQNPLTEVFTRVCVATAGSYDAAFAALSGLIGWTVVTAPEVAGVTRLRAWTKAREEPLAVLLGTIRFGEITEADICVVAGVSDPVVIQRFFTSVLRAEPESNVSGGAQQSYRLDLGGNIVELKFAIDEVSPRPPISVQLTDLPDWVFE